MGRVWETVGDYRISLSKLEGKRTLEDLEIDGMILFK